MVVNPGNTLRRGGANGKVIAAAPARAGAPAPPAGTPRLWWDGDGGAPAKTLSLGWPKYSEGTNGEAGDRLSIAGRDYRTQYVALRKARPDLRNKIVARAVRDPDTGQLWLQYWFWYVYNDYQLAFNVGLHEGDWEMIQLGLRDEVPVVAVYAQHDRGRAATVGSGQEGRGRYPAGVLGSRLARLVLRAGRVRDRARGSTSPTASDPRSRRT